MWVGLGNALVDHARTLTPGASFAFRRAAEIAPGHPAPSFFFGLAEARSGDREVAVDSGARSSPGPRPSAGWRPIVEDALRAVTRPRRAATAR